MVFARGFPDQFSECQSHARRTISSLGGPQIHYRCHYAGNPLLPKRGCLVSSVLMTWGSVRESTHDSDRATRLNSSTTARNFSVFRPLKDEIIAPHMGHRALDTFQLPMLRRRRFGDLTGTWRPSRQPIRRTFSRPMLIPS